MTTPTWQRELANAVRDPAELFELLDLDPDLLPGSLEAHASFPLMVPRPYLSRIRRSDPTDPLLRQILPTGDELLPLPGYSDDPVGEKNVNPVPGLIHKYHGRVLLIGTPQCASNCRYCFRRHFAYSENNPSRRQWQQALDYIAANNSIEEVILSGGDPLTAGDRHLAWFSAQLANIDHVKRLRIHTRMPVLIPSRIDEDCLAWLTGSRLLPIMVVHINHPDEIDDDVAGALLRLQKAGITLLNQSVLLRAVNDNLITLSRLSDRLFESGVLPYYLHLLDRVNGAGKFEVEEESALRLIDGLSRQLPGYLIPRLVREESGKNCKRRLA